MFNKLSTIKRGSTRVREGEPRTRGTGPHASRLPAHHHVGDRPRLWKCSNERACARGKISLV